MYIRYKFFTNDSFDAMQSTDLDAERESSPRSLKSRENEEQSVKLSDRLWMVKEVLTFGRKPTNWAKSYKTNRTAINKWFYTYKKQGFLKDSKGQPPILRLLFVFPTFETSWRRLSFRIQICRLHCHDYYIWVNFDSISAMIPFLLPTGIGSCQ